MFYDRFERKESSKAGRPRKRSLHSSDHRMRKAWAWVVGGGCVHFLGLSYQSTTDQEA